MYEVTINRSFSAAHTLRDVGGKCESLHGHNFRVEVTVAGESLNGEGLLVDFRLLKRWTDEALEMLDHRHLNEMDFFADSNPSSENLARWIHDHLADRIDSDRVRVSRVTVWESEDARAVYESGADRRHS
ncbi:MAG: 6-carboxytetrahydropterin synthase QueD [Deltaproteobacteria bacterium HGW-Deltaproteobacteria-19]|jgi:6-pyruvoyltetrahydropterin/6-carboxytetrahydropterin synthase|nr:MAG: 6-carboxytetrahydropterin synthase QueD [Deltaproteobacteria bacterium HGW-Deltaproteobacteria-19]